MRFYFNLEVDECSKFKSYCIFNLEHVKITNISARVVHNDDLKF